MMANNDTTTPEWSMADWAVAYIEAGLSLCQLRPNSKAPMLTGWNSPKQAINDPVLAASVFADGRHGFGCIHAASLTATFDIDALRWAIVAFESFGVNLLELLSGYPRIKGREGRDKILFRNPNSLTTVKLVWPPQEEGGKPFVVFELRGAGGQDVLPPSIHPDTGKPYEWVVSPFELGEIPTMPPMLEALWENWKDFQPQFEAACPWAKPSVAEVPKPIMRHISTHDTDVIGQFNAAYPVEQMLEQFGYRRKGERRYLAPSSQSGLAGVYILPDSGRCYSHHASDVLNDGHAHDSFDLLVLLKHNGNFIEALKEAAKDLGIAAPARQEEPILSGVKAFVDSVAPKKKSPRLDTSPIERKPILRLPTPEILLNPPGVLGEFVRYQLQTSHLEQPELAVAAALCLGGLALGRQVMTATGLRTNLYLIGVAKTGYGKERARQAIKEVLICAQLAELLGGEEIASGQGLISRVAKSPNQIFMLDEFGLFLQSVQSPNAASHKAEIVTNFMKMFSSAGTIYRGTEYADQEARKRKDIEYPCVTMYATTTPETLFPALGSAHVASGYLNRILTCFSPELRPTRKRVRVSTPPSTVVEWARGAQSRLFDRWEPLQTAGNPVTLGESQEAFDLLDRFQTEIDLRTDEGEKTGTSQLWARSMEHTMKIALVIQLSINPSSEEIGVEAAQWAIEFVRYHQTVMAAEIVERVADSDFARIVLEAIRNIKRAGEQGLTERELSKQSRGFRALRPSERDQVVAILLRDEEAAWKQAIKVSGQKRSALVAADYWPILEKIADRSPTNGAAV